MAPSQMRNRRKVTWMRMAVPPTDPRGRAQRMSLRAFRGEGFCIQYRWVGPVAEPTQLSPRGTGTQMAASSSLPLAQQPQAQRVELDEAFGVLLVVGAFIVLEGDDLVGVERFRALPADDHDIALIELEHD